VTFNPQLFAPFLIILTFFTFLIVSQSRDIFLEKHWKSVVQRNICEYFFDALKKVSTSGESKRSSNVPVALQTPHYCLIHISRNDLYLLAVTSNEVAPLFVIEFLHRVVDLINDYFGECTENIIKENYVIVYELLDEMLDNGYPFATESNILKELIRPPNLFRTIANSMTGKSK
jgi:AP-3 complex subunit mu